MNVAVPALVDPADATDGDIDGPQAGTRLVAVELALSDQGPDSINDNANSDTAIIGSDSQDYTPVFTDVSECTNFNDGDYALANGSTQRGCVVFDLPDGVTADTVQFSLGGNTIDFSKP